MKKQYINPDMEIINIQTTQMLAASQVGFGDPVNTAAGAEAPEMPEPELPGIPPFVFNFE